MEIWQVGKDCIEITNSKVNNLQILLCGIVWHDLPVSYNCPCGCLCFWIDLLRFWWISHYLRDYTKLMIAMNRTKAIAKPRDCFQNEVQSKRRKRRNQWKTNADTHKHWITLNNVSELNYSMAIKSQSVPHLQQDLFISNSNHVYLHLRRYMDMQ